MASNIKKAFMKMYSFIWTRPLDNKNATGWVVLVMDFWSLRTIFWVHEWKWLSHKSHIFLWEGLQMSYMMVDLESWFKSWIFFFNSKETWDNSSTSNKLMPLDEDKFLTCHTKDPCRYTQGGMCKIVRN